MVWGFCWCCFSKCQMCCLCLQNEEGRWEFIEKAKPLKYLHVTSVWSELQLTMNVASNPHYQLCRDKAAVVNPYSLLVVPDSVVHTRVSLLPNWKSKIQEQVFLKTNASSRYNAKSLQGSSLSQGFYVLFQSTKLQPGVWLPAASLPPQDAAAYFTIESCSQKLR